MPEPYSAQVGVVGEPRPPTAPAAEEARHALVIEVYEATLARSSNERSAFDAAVRLYRAQDPDLAEDDVRRAVANIICRKP